MVEKITKLLKYPYSYLKHKVLKDNDNAIRISNINKECFFGYYNLNPSDADNKHVLYHSVEKKIRMPNAESTAEVGLIDLENNYKNIVIDHTKAWSWQLGSMLQWVNNRSGKSIIYNTVIDNKYASKEFNLEKASYKIYTEPVFCVNRTGDLSITIDFNRLHYARPGYGYVALFENFTPINFPDNDGVWLYNLKNGNKDLIVTFRQLANNNPRDFFDTAFHWVNHLEFSPSGKVFAFIHRWKINGIRKSRLYIANIDGTGLKCLLDYDEVSHYTWQNDDTIIIWANDSNYCAHYLIVSIANGSISNFCKGLLSEDGHPTFSPNGNYLITDTYPDNERLKSLLLVNPENCDSICLGKYFTPISYRGAYRNDLHPRWINNKTICFDSVHEGKRAIYLLDINPFINA